MILTIWDSEGLRIFTNLHLSHKFREVAVIERHGCRQHGVEDHAKTPHVTLRSHVWLFEDDLGRCVQWTAAVCSDHWFTVGVLGETKVCNLFVCTWKWRRGGVIINYSLKVNNSVYAFLPICAPYCSVGFCRALRNCFLFTCIGIQATWSHNL